MSMLKAILYSLPAILVGFLLFVWVSITVQSVSLSMPRGAKPFARMIVYTETGTRLFQKESWRSKGRPDIDRLFDAATIALLKKHNCEIEMAVDDFSPKSASAVRTLNNAGIKVWVWPLHPIEDGYWLSIDNADKFPALYEKFTSWIAKNGIRVHGVMLDMEASYGDTQVMAKKASAGGVRGVLGYLLARRDPVLHAKAKAVYDGMVRRMKSDGFEVSTFNYPYLIDDRRDGDSSIQEMFHVAYVDTDLASFMCYRSFFRDSGLGTGGANVLSYMRSLSKEESAGIGDYMNEDIRFEDFADDLRMAARFSPVVHVYNLEGLLSRGFLSRMDGVSLDEQVRVPFRESLAISGYRTFFRLLDLFTGSSALTAVASLLILWALVVLYFYKKNRLAISPAARARTTRGKPKGQ